jgi:hypothetical protein
MRFLEAALAVDHAERPPRCSSRGDGSPVARDAEAGAIKLF